MTHADAGPKHSGAVSDMSVSSAQGRQMLVTVGSGVRCRTTLRRCSRFLLSEQGGVVVPLSSSVFLSRAVSQAGALCTWAASVASGVMMELTGSARHSLY